MVTLGHKFRGDTNPGERLLPIHSLSNSSKTKNNLEGRRENKSTVTYREKGGG